MEHIRPGAHVPEEAVLVCPSRVRADTRIACALVQLEDTRVHGSSHIDGRGAVQVDLGTREHVREEGVRVEQA